MDKETYFKYLNNKGHNKDIKALEDYADKFNVPIIQKNALDIIQALIKVHSTKKILEIGSAIGYSAINFANVSKDIFVTTIERDKKMAELARENIHCFQLDKRIRLIEEDALTFDESTLGKDFDFLFIDAAKSQYEKFFNKYTKCLKTGGIVVTDNLIFHDLVFEDYIENRNTRQLVKKIKNYNEWLKNNELFDTTFLNIGDGISISIKK